MSKPRVIDAHTHAFPDELAGRAVSVLEAAAGIRARLNGTISALLASMDRHGIDASIVCSIATKPSQTEPILTWSKKIRSERIIPFPSIHPADPIWPEHLRRISGEGFLGIKLHPYYQEFELDEPRLLRVYEHLSRLNLAVVMHTGYDMAYALRPGADPPKIARIAETFPSLRMLTTHMGSWKQWDSVEKHLIGSRIFMEISYSLQFLPAQQSRRMIRSHPRECVCFGTDSPWTDQGEELARLRALGLGTEMEERVLGRNILDFLARG